MKNFENIPVSAVFAAIKKALSKGFIIEDEKDIESNYNDALDFLFDNKPNNLKIIIGDGNTRHVDAVLPLSGGWWVSGELYYNAKNKRVEEVAQDLDGTCYLVIAN